MSRDPLRLTSRDKTWLLVLVLIGAACLTLGIRLYPRAFPEASIKFDLDRKGSQARAENVLRTCGFDVAGYRHASTFAYDDTAKVFLERELGLTEMNHAVVQTAKIWTWSHRWFRPLQKEEFRVAIAPSGETVKITHLLPEDAPGARIPQDQARSIAEAFLAGVRPAGLGDLRFLGATSNDLKNRTDHVFTWEESGVDWKGGRYRHEVVIQGDKPGGYAEFVHVPEGWLRDYQLLRSKNTTAGVVDSVFFILTFLAMIVILILRVRAGRIRWRFAIIFGLVGASLNFLSTLNGLPNALYGYQTTDSFGGFIMSAVLRGLGSAVGFGLAILVIVAAGESLYRSGYAGKLSVPGFFTRRGLRTKEFFFSTLGGLVLMCFFLAYQCVFYLIATKFGAWSPAEVPYDELLNSAFPWAFLLFFGFMPAVTEEFMSRAFSIPFFTKLFRNRAFAVVLAAFIWGFGHATYPNQPFYIRGLEVGLAGILIGVLMLRFNILTTLVWHYTVDALYSGILLLRSHNPYYVITAAAAGGIFVLPFAISLIAYLRTKSFADPEPLRQGIEVIPEPAAMKVEERAEAAAAVPLSAPVAVGTSARRAIVVIAGSAAVLALLSLASSKVGEPKTPVRIDRASALRRAEVFLKGRGLSPDGFRHGVRFQNEVEPDQARYVLSQAGFSRIGEVWPGRLPAQVWSVRYFKPLTVEELRVHVDAESGRVVTFDHRIAEKDSLATVSAARAESLATALLASVRLPTDGMERKEAADKPRDKRMDRRFAWEAREGDPRNVGEARYRLEASVTGDRAAAFLARLRLPEAYERARNRHTALWGLALGLMLAGAAGTFALALRDGLRAHMRGEIPWKRLLRIGLIGIALSLLSMVNAWPRFVSTYVTTVPWGSYLVLYIVGMVTSVIFYFGVSWAGVALARGLQPSVASLTDPASIRRMLPGAAVALVVVPMWGRILSLVRLLAAGRFPGAADPPDLHMGGRLEMALPGLAVAISVIVGTFALAWAVAALARVLTSREWPGRPLRLVLFAALALGIALNPARSTGEGIWGIVRIALTVAIGYGLIRVVVRGNPLAVLAGVYGLLAFRGAADLLSQPNSWVRGQGILAAVLLLAPIAWFLVLAGRRSAVLTNAPAREGRAP